MDQQLMTEWRLKAMEDWQNLEPKDILTPDTCTCTCSVEFVLCMTVIKENTRTNH